MTRLSLHWPTSAGAVSLPPGAVHVWSVAVDGARPGWQSWLPVLAADERARAERFRIARARERFVLFRAALRSVLGDYLGIERAAVALRYDAYGKPSLDGAVHPAVFEFNMSHSSDLALIAVARDCSVGVDVERIRTVRHQVGIAERFFHSDEAGDVLGYTAAGRAAAFFRCWTRKEAIVKAIGTGLSYPLDAFRVPVGPTASDWVLLPAHTRVVSQRLWLENLLPCDGFAAALATVGSRPTCTQFRMDLAGERLLRR